MSELRWVNPYSFIIDSRPWCIKSPRQLLPLLDRETVHIPASWYAAICITYVYDVFGVTVYTSHRETTRITVEKLEQFIIDGIMMYHPKQKL